MTLLQEMARERNARREQLRRATRRQLQTALAELLPGASVIFFGSLVRSGEFSETSDVDLALTEEPVGISIYQLASLLGERLGRPVDVLLLDECRFRDKILREGETWTLPA